MNRVDDLQLHEREGEGRRGRGKRGQIFHPLTPHLWTCHPPRSLTDAPPTDDPRTHDPLRDVRSKNAPPTEDTLNDVPLSKISPAELEQPRSAAASMSR